MSGIEGGGTKKPEAPSNIISHRFRELKQAASVDQLTRLVPWQVRIVMRDMTPESEEVRVKKLIQQIQQSSDESSHVTNDRFVQSLRHKIKIGEITDPDDIKKIAQLHIRLMSRVFPIDDQIDPEFTPHNKKRYPQDRTLVDYDEMDAWRQQLNSRTVYKNPDVIKVIQESDMKWSESVNNFHETNKLGFVAADSEGRVVFLPELRFDHINFEIRKNDWSTRFEQFVMSGIINNDFFNFLQLIHEVVTTGDIEEIIEEGGKKPGYSYRKVFKEVRGLRKTIDRIINVVTSVNGMIVTVTFDDEK